MHHEHAVSAGPTNSIVDVAGIRVGHRTAAGGGWLTGTTVVLPESEGAVGGVDVRGGGPGTRETDLLDPRNAVERVNAVVLGGGSAFGLAAAHGVAQRLAEDGAGVVVETGEVRAVVPIVPAAIAFDLGRGGDLACRPDESFGRAAYDAATASAPEQGNAGAGTGAVAGPVKGGVGSASTLLADGTTLGALAVVNCVGSPLDPADGRPLGARRGLPGEFPEDAVGPRHAAPEDTSPPPSKLNTTLAVVATDITLTKAQCAKLAGIGHDGLARAIHPAHSMFDGDTVFALSTTRRPAPGPAAFHALLAAAADCVTRAIVHGLLAARTVRTPAGHWHALSESYRT